MRENLNYNILGLPICEKCGVNTVPPGKKLCWCCEHTPKLHVDDKRSCVSKDACDPNLEATK